MSDRKPVMPYRLEKVVNDDFSYMIDKDGIIWMTQHVTFLSPKRDFGICYVDNCLRECLTYIIAYAGFEEYQNIKKYITEHLVKPKEECYDSILKKYDKIWTKKEDRG